MTDLSLHGIETDFIYRGRELYGLEVKKIEEKMRERDRKSMTKEWAKEWTKACDALKNCKSLEKIYLTTNKDNLYVASSKNINNIVQQSLNNAV